MGKNRPDLAREYFKTILIVSLTIISLISFMVYIFKEKLIGLITDSPEVRKEALSTVWIFVIHTYPDVFKLMLKGFIMALGI